MAPLALFAQPTTDVMEIIGGTTYVVAFPDTTRNNFDARYPDNRFEDKAMLFIYSAIANRVSIRGHQFQRDDVALAAGTFTVIDLTERSSPAPRPIVDEHCRAVANTFRITAQEPIVVYQYLLTRFGTEAWTALPVESWGREYYVAAHAGEVLTDIKVPGGAEGGWKGPNLEGPGEILVIAAYDDTRITIVPNALTRGFCNTTNITLKAGEAFQVQSVVDTFTANGGIEQGDYAGSRVFATRPVGVISGNTRAQLLDHGPPLAQLSAQNMLIEWISPADQHGTEFVYMPTWDDRRPTGMPNENLQEKRAAEFVRVYGTQSAPTDGYFVHGGIGYSFNDPIEQGRFQEFRHTPNQARVYRTEVPAQVVMSTPSTRREAIRTFEVTADDYWGSSMVTIVPRERWVAFSPYYAPSWPAGMAHYINVVTDTVHRNDVYLRDGTRFPFTRVIEGTDLIWGSMEVTPGVTNTLTGSNGARFGGHVYGTLVAGGRDELRHNRGYVQALAVAYAYPLAAANVAIGAGDSLVIKTTHECGSSPEFAGMILDIKSVNESPVGLRSVRLEYASNVTIASTNPSPLTDAVRALVSIRVIDTRVQASATIVITDRSGKITRIPYTFTPEGLTSTPRLSFGVMNPGDSDTMSITVANRGQHALTVRALQLDGGSVPFTILSTLAFPFTLAPGDSLVVVVRANPPLPDREYVDSISVRGACVTLKIPVTVETSNPCVNVHDLNFDMLDFEATRTLPLRICNDGGGVVSFNNPTGGDVIEWKLRTFSIAAADLLRVKSAQLARGECITVPVTFTASAAGQFVDSARIWASTRRCRDVSEWRAGVEQRTGAESETGLANTLSEAMPNPFTGESSIRLTLARASVVAVDVFDDRGALVAKLLDGHRNAGVHRIDLSLTALPTGIYHVRFTAGSWTAMRSIVKLAQ